MQFLQTTLLDEHLWLINIILT